MLYHIEKFGPLFESYFTKYINENDNKLTFKAKRLRGKTWEPMYTGEITEKNPLKLKQQLYSMTQY